MKPKWKHAATYGRKKRRERMQATGSNAYLEYLRSPQWAKKCRKARRHYGHRCSICGRTDNLRVHHRHYRTLFHEAMTDLDLQCDGCHKNTHEHEGKCADPMTAEFIALAKGF